MKTAISKVLFVASTLLVVQLSLTQPGYAQRTVSATFESFFEEVGIMVDDTFVPVYEATEQQLAGNPPLFENHSEDHLPLLMPDGTTPIAYDQFGAVTGNVTIVDVGDQGTQVTMSVDNLIPGGVYTVWADYYQAPGFTPDFAHELALGALGYDAKNPPENPNDYLGNVIIADTDGHGELEAIQPPGPASWFTTDVISGFEVPPYVLDPPVAELDLVVAYHIDGKSWGLRAGQGEGFDAFDATWVGQGIAIFISELQAGDADQDFDFDQDDVIQVQQAGKYLTGEPATWGQGDWDGAPGGTQGFPPIGDGVFDQFDIIAALLPATYLTGPYATIQPDGQAGDGQTSVVYNPATGELAVDAPAGVELTSINVDSAASIFTGQSAENLGGSFDNDADNNLFKATFGSSFGSLSFGNVAQPDLSEQFVLNDLSVIGSLAGGGDLGNVDLIYVPEPSAAVIALIGVLGVITWFRSS